MARQLKSQPASKPPFRFIDLFAGIGGIRIALEAAGGTCVFASEWNEHAASSYEAYFGHRPNGDITKIDADDIPDHDVLGAGFPCQAFSIMGERKGFHDTRGTLFFDILRILECKRPKAFLLENVRNLVSHDQGRTFDTIRRTLAEIGYQIHWRVLNALDYNLPQKRERVVIVGFSDPRAFTWPSPVTRAKTLGELLEAEKDVDKKYFASHKVARSVAARLRAKPLPPEPWISHENKSGNVSPLPYSCALRAGASYNYLLVNGKRRLTPREHLRLQGFPEDYPIVVSDSEIRKQCGNSVPVPMIEAVAHQVRKALSEPVLQTAHRVAHVAANQHNFEYFK